MNITVNGEPRQSQGSVADLLDEIRGDRHPTGIAVAVGEVVVPRDAWPEWQLHDGDVVEIVTAVQGG